MKIKQFVLFALILCLLTGTAQAAEKKAKKEKNVVIYNGEISRRYPTSYTNVYEQMDTESKKLTTMNAGQKIQITAVYPGWVAIKYGSGLGYVMRHRIDVTENMFPGTNPDYPITPQYYYAVIDRPVNVKADKDENSETISVLTEGARVSLCGVEDGWAVLYGGREYAHFRFLLLLQRQPGPHREPGHLLRPYQQDRSARRSDELQRRRHALQPRQRLSPGPGA